MSDEADDAPVVADSHEPEPEFNVDDAFFKTLGVEEGSEEVADEEAPEGTTGASKASPESTDPDDAEVEWGPAESRHKAALRDLKAAFNDREASSRIVSEANTLRERAALTLNKAVAQAKASWEPYAKIDWITLSRDASVDQETFQHLRTEAQKHYANLTSLTSELDGAVQEQRNQHQHAYQANLDASVKALQDPKTGIPGFNQELYANIIRHAISTGSSESDARSVTAPWAVKMMHDAMLYRQGVESAKTKIAAVVNKPTRTLQPGAQRDVGEKGSLKAAMSRLRDNPNDSDMAADVFMASFAS